MGSPTFAIARPAVDVLIRTITGDYRVQILRAIVALVTIAVPLATLGQHQFGSKHHSTATWAARTLLSLDLGRVHNGPCWGQGT